MRTVRELRNIINYMQTDEHFVNFVNVLVDQGIAVINVGDIVESEGVYRVSDDFYRQIAGLYGNQLDDELNIIQFEEGKY